MENDLKKTEICRWVIGGEGGDEMKSSQYQSGYAREGTCANDLSLSLSLSLCLWCDHLDDFWPSLWKQVTTFEEEKYLISWQCHEIFFIFVQSLSGR